jgi:hypothetical protein
LLLPGSASGGTRPACGARPACGRGARPCGERGERGERGLNGGKVLWVGGVLSLCDSTAAAAAAAADDDDADAAAAAADADADADALSSTPFAAAAFSAAAFSIACLCWNMRPSAKKFFELSGLSDAARWASASARSDAPSRAWQSARVRWSTSHLLLTAMLRLRASTHSSMFPCAALSLYSALAAPCTATACCLSSIAC